MRELYETIHQQQKREQDNQSKMLEIEALVHKVEGERAEFARLLKDTKQQLLVSMYISREENHEEFHFLTN